MMVVVTGGAGFVGSHLCERLVRDGHTVISLDNYFTGSKENHIAGVEYREGHTKDIETLVPEKPDIVYHLGEYSRVEKSFEDIAQVWNLNQLGTFAVLEFVRRRGAKLVYAGSSTKFSTDELGSNQSPYAWSKATNTELVKNYGTWFGISYAITYFYNVYGPRERPGAFGTVIAIFKENYKRGKPLAVVSPGDQRRNFTHVEDIVSGLVKVGESGVGDGFAIGDERSYSIMEIAQLFKTDIIMLPERRGNRSSATLDTRRIRELGWVNKHSVVEDIHTYINEVERANTHPESRVLVYTTTFYPCVGPAEEALCVLMKSMPDVHFDVVTARYSKNADKETCPVPNATVYRVGTGTPFDKFLLPLLGGLLGLRLTKQHQYFFVWSLVASYGTFAAMWVRAWRRLPLLVSLADQGVSLRLRAVLRVVLASTDQIHTSTMEQEKHLISLQKRMRSTNVVGDGDALSNAIRFAYSNILKK